MSAIGATNIVALAAVAVADIDAARDYYTRMFGRGPDLEPMPTLKQWTLGEGALQVVAQPENAGRTMATLLVADFDGFYAQLRDAGLEPSDPAGGVISRVTQVSDLDGNVITVAEA